VAQVMTRDESTTQETPRLGPIHYRQMNAKEEEIVVDALAGMLLDVARERTATSAISSFIPATEQD